MSEMGEQLAAAWIGLGSNLGDRLANLRSAAEMLPAQSDSRIAAVSSIYSSAPVGEGFSRDFYNAVVGLRTALGPRDLLAACRGIEAVLGRGRGAGPDRTIDIDILFYRDLCLDEADLVIPHPRIAQRRFVLEPLAEVAPLLIHPGAMLTVNQMLEMVDKGQVVERLEGALLVDADG